MLEILSEPRVLSPDFAVNARRSVPLDRREWMRRCGLRLTALRPDEPAEQISRVVSELWRAAPQFHPETAAEMEHECW